MKKVIISILVPFLLTTINKTALSQTANDKTFKVCVTVSCCGIGPFSLEIWSETTCNYVTVNVNKNSDPSKANMLVATFNNGVPIKDHKINVTEDVLLAGSYDDQTKTALFLPKGDYEVDNNSIEFLPIERPSIKICIKRVVNGSLFGNTYSYTINFCIIIPSPVLLKALNPNFSLEEMNRIKSSGTADFEVNEDTLVSQDNINFTLKKGIYKVNSDGTIYLQFQKVN